MSVSITQINGTDSISTLRTVINNNFENVKDELERVESVVDSDSNITSNSITVTKGVRPTSTILVKNEGSEDIDGDLNVDGDTTLRDLFIPQGSVVNISGSDINILGTGSTLDIEGTTTIKGVLVYSGFETAVDGSFRNLYESGNSVYGNLKVDDKNALILNFANYSSSSDDNAIKDFGILPGVKQGQTLTMVLNTASSNGKPHRILNTNNNIGTLTSGQAISFNQDGCVVEFVWIGSKWFIKSLFRGEIV